MELARIIISIVLALMLTVTGGGKLIGIKYATANRDALGINRLAWRGIGVLELAAVVGLIWGIWFVPFGIAAAIGVALLMLGAIGFRLRSGKAEVIRQAVADIVVFVLAVVVIVISVLTVQSR